ncbi:SPFH domain-containing protein [Streptomyces sp. NBC_01310]|uniref:SPFH domain-containing protein n=1 Tax=Streptomyces sp. NBC_01310 TaxID=2903820 RepID=UPI0035B58CC6|nr:SPFH domain-containing protein [Streptomyces sp. NBC_01310]
MAQHPESASTVRPAQAPPRPAAQEPQHGQQPARQAQETEVAARASEPAASTARPGQASPWAAAQRTEAPASTVRPTQSSPWSATPVREFGAPTGRPTQESEHAQQPVREAQASSRAAAQQTQVPARASEPTVSEVRPGQASPWAAAHQAEVPAPTVRPTQAASPTAEGAAPAVRPTQASSRAAAHEVEGVATARAVVPEPAAEHRQAQAEVPAARSQCEPEPAYASAGHGTYDTGGQGSDPQGITGLDIPHPQDEAAHAGVATVRLRRGAPEAAAAHPQHSRPESTALDAEPHPEAVPHTAPEPAAGTEPKARPGAQVVPVFAAGTVPEPARETHAVPVSGAGAEPKARPGAQAVPVRAAGAMVEPLPGAGRQPEPGTQAGAARGAQAVSGAGAEPKARPGAQAVPVPEPGTQPELEDGTLPEPEPGAHAAGAGVPGPGVVEIVAQAVARGLDKPGEGGRLQATPRLGRPRGAAVTEVPVHLPFRGEPHSMPAPTPTAGPAAGGRAPRPAPGRRVPRGDDRLREHRGPVLPGWVAVAVGGIALAGCTAVLWRAGAVPAPFLAAFGAAPRAYQGLRATHWPPLAFLGIVALVALGGLGRARAGHAWVLTLFGRYRGTVRRTGLTWVSPLLLRRRVDVRLRHWRSDPMPAVDSGGLALQVVVQVVWQVKDTARATLAVEDHTEYLAEQVESAMARVLSQLPADAFHEDAPTLRDAEAVGDALTRMLAAETEAVGIEVFSAQPTRIEYAAEVAEAMRRRRVAAIDAKHRDSVLSSVVDAVDDTVHRLTSRGLVELDDYERKALVKDLTVAFYTGRPE